MFSVFELSYQIAFPSLSNSSEGTTTNVGGWQDVGKPFEVGSGGVYTVALIDPSTTVDLSDVSSPPTHRFTHSVSLVHMHTCARKSVRCEEKALLLYPHWTHEPHEDFKCGIIIVSNL